MVVLVVPYTFVDPRCTPLVFAENPQSLILRVPFDAAPICTVIVFRIVVGVALSWLYHWTVRNRQRPHIREVIASGFVLRRVTFVRYDTSYHNHTLAQVVLARFRMYYHCM